MLKKMTLISAATVFILLITGGNAMALAIQSSAFKDGGTIPAKYTCDGGGDVSPPLSWGSSPAGTKSFALISDDPDAPAGTWVHWVVWNIPPAVTSFREGMPKDPKLSDGTMQGITDFRRAGFGSPCPPNGKHRYYFKLYALDCILELPASTTKAGLESAMSGHILEQATIMASYTRGGG